MLTTTRYGLQKPETTDPVTKLRQTIAANADICEARLDGQIVSTLPTTGLASDPTVYFQNAAMADAGVVWHLKYRSAASGSYKWEFVGGSRLESSTSITVPLAGDYEVVVGGKYSPYTGTAGYSYMATFTVTVNAAAAATSPSAVVDVQRDNAGSAERSRTMTAIPALAVLAPNVTTTTTGTVSDYLVAARPVRVG